MIVVDVYVIRDNVICFEFELSLLVVRNLVDVEFLLVEIMFIRYNLYMVCFIFGIVLIFIILFVIL